MSRLAIYTYGSLHGSYTSEVGTSFFAAATGVFAEAEQADGFIARAARPSTEQPLALQAYGPWGQYAVPDFYQGTLGEAEDTVVATLSLWQSLDALKAFAYRGVHRQALARKGEWFERRDGPMFTLWWVSDEEFPTWSDAVRRIQILSRDGASPQAFTFARPYDPDGLPVT